MKTKVIDITNYWHEKAEVIIRRLTYGQRSKLISETTRTKIIGNNPITDTDLYALRIKVLLYGIEKAPFELTQQAIENLDAELGDLLFEEIDKFNTRPNELASSGQ